MKIIPVKDNILLKYVHKEEVTKGGIHIPDTVKRESIDMPDRGEIIAIGEKVDTKLFKVGETVLFRRTDAMKIFMSGEDTEDASEVKFMMIKDNQILGKIES